MVERGQPQATSALFQSKVPPVPNARMNLCGPHSRSRFFGVRDNFVAFREIEPRFPYYPVCNHVTRMYILDRVP